MRAYIILILGFVLLGCSKTHYYVHEYTEDGDYDGEESYKYTTVELDWKTPTTGVAKIRLYSKIDKPHIEDYNPQKSYLYFETRFRNSRNKWGVRYLRMKTPEFIYMKSRHLLDLVCDTRTYNKKINNSSMRLEDNNKLKGFRDYLFDIGDLMGNSDCVGGMYLIYDKICILYGMSDFTISIDDNDLHKTDSIDYTKFEPYRKSFTEEIKGIKLPPDYKSIDDVILLIIREQVIPGDCKIRY